MRPVDCEACHQPQPKDWQPGQRCVHCGGAVRTETRCAACTRWTPAGRFCRHCAAELVPDEWYGAARMLTAAGVDALSLAARVSALDPAQREAFSSRFAVQRAVVEQLVLEARFAEGFLATAGHADALEETLIAELPWRDGALAEYEKRPKGPWHEAAQLETLRTQSPRFETRGLAAVALVRRGDVRREVLADAWSRLHVDDALGVEALLALARAELVADVDAVTRWQRDDAKALVERARATPGIAVEAAVAEGVLIRLRERDVPAKLEAAGLLPRLREGLLADDAGLRFACAVLLGDADTLDRLVDAPGFFDRALKELSRLRSKHLVRRLREARDDETRRALLRRLHAPLDGDDFVAVVELAQATAGELQRDALRLLVRTPWERVEPFARDALAAWVARQELAPEVALDLLHWAVHTEVHSARYRPAADVQAFAVVAARALARAPRDRKTLSLHHLDDFFAVAGGGRALDCVLDWVQDDATRDDTLRAVFSLQSYQATTADPPDARGVELLFAVWERLGDAGRARLAPHFAEVFRREGGSRALPAVLRAFWERFVTHPGERAAVWEATRPFRRELEALRDADARAEDFDGGDPARRFVLYGALDPLTAPELLRALCEAHRGDAALTGLTPHVVAIAGTLFERGEHRHAMWLTGSWASEVVNRFREDATREAWRAAALGLADAHAAVVARRAATTPKDPGDSLRTFEEQWETELRLVREGVEREEASLARERQRAAERDAREAERRRQEEERRAEVARREAAAAEEAKRQLAAAREALSLQTAAVADSGGGDALDTEVLVPEHPLRTLRDYVAFMRAMRAGADVMALFAQHELTPATWGACAGAWATVMTKRMDVALRFATLLQ